MSNKITITTKQAKMIHEVLWMGCLWGKSLIDAGATNGRRDTKKALKAHEIMKNKLNKIKTPPHDV